MTNVVGTAASETIDASFGTPVTDGPDTISALEGNDTVFGLGGNDFIKGGDGAPLSARRDAPAFSERGDDLLQALLR